MKTKNSLMSLAIVCAILLVNCTVRASIVLPSPDLPPVFAGVGYLGDSIEYPGILMVGPFLTEFTDVVRTDDGFGNEIETFDCVLTAVAESGLGPFPIVLTGPATVKTDGKIGNVTGLFGAEMVSLSLTGNIGGTLVTVQESPNLPSTGQTTITDLGGGLYDIDSFFDVFTELSLDGGSFMPALSGPTRITLIPEPATIVLLGLGSLTLLRRKARARTD